MSKMTGTFLKLNNGVSGLECGQETAGEVRALWVSRNDNQVGLSITE